MTDTDTAEWNAAIEQAARTAEGVAEFVSGNLYESLCHKIAVDIRALSRPAPAARETVGALRAMGQLDIAAAAGAPEGWKLVPIELTPEIACALEDGAPPTDPLWTAWPNDALARMVEDYRETWARVLAASPAPQPEN